MATHVAEDETGSGGDRPVSVVIVTWNARQHLLACLQALAQQLPTTLEVTVVDNHSTDGTLAALRQHAPWVRVIANLQNRGLPAANNQGIASSSGAYVLIANPDTEVLPGAVDALIDVLDRHSRAAFAVPRLLYGDGSLHVSVGDLPTLREALLGRQAQRSHQHVASGFWWDGWAHDEEREVGRGHEACYLVRRTAIADIGLQDERFFLDWEGIDWTARARARGWQVWFTPKAEVVHHGGASIRQVPMRWIVNTHRGMYRYFAKRNPPTLRPLLALIVTARALMKAVAAVFGRANYERGHRSA